MKATHKILASLGAALVLVSLGIGAMVWSFRQIDAAATARKQTYAIIISADNLLSELKDAETGQRGYALTGNPAFLQPYLAVRDGVLGHLADVRLMNQLAPAQSHLDALAPLIQAKLKEMAQVIELRRQHDPLAAQAAVGSGQGMRLMDAIRSEMSTFSQLEKDALAGNEARFQSTMQRLFALILVASVLGLGFALLFAVLVYRQSQQRLQVQRHRETQGLLLAQEKANLQLHQANATLRESEEKLSVTLNSIGDAMMATDAQARVTRLNPVAEQLTGWRHAEAVGQPVTEVFRIINQETRQAATLPVTATLAQGTIQGLANHTILISRNGTEYAIADSCAPIRDRDGQVLGAVLVFRDVTRDHAEQLVSSQMAAQIETILNTVADGIITFQARGGHIETVNPAAERLFGYRAAELVGQQFSVLVPELERDPQQDSMDFYGASAQARAVGRGREVLGRRRDGSQFPLEIAVSEMWLGGQHHYTSILRNISVRIDAEQALIQAGALQNAIFNSANFSAIATDAQGVIQLFNVGAERMLGYAATDVLNKITPADISDPQEVIKRATELSAELETPIAPGFEALVFKASRGIEDIYELTYIRKDGSRFPAVVSVTALRDDGGAIIGYLLIGTDNTARKQSEADQKVLGQRLRDHQFYTRSLFEANIDALMTTDPAGIITDVNKQMEALTACTRDELIGAPFKNYFTDPERAETAIKLVLYKQKVTNYQLTARDRNGKETVVSYNATTFYDRDRRLQGVFAAARDITERKETEKQILQLALHDALTHLPNRRLLTERLEQMMAASKRSGRYGALMFLDMDNFKSLNDSQGHNVGDLLLIELAQRLSTCVRQVDVVARFGGDEFVVILSELDKDKAASTKEAGVVAEKIRAILEKPFVLTVHQEGQADTSVEHHCSSSIGVMLFLNHMVGTEDIIKWADSAMYQAKEAGGNTIRFSDA